MAYNDLNKDLLKSITSAKKKKNVVKDVIFGKVYKEYEDCKECHGTLYKEDGNMCSCMKEYILMTKLKKANIGEKYYHVTLDFYSRNMKDMYLKFLGSKQQKNVKFFIQYVNLYIETFDKRLKDGRGFLVCGETGCGKTGALCYILKKLALSNYNVFYIDTNELLETISASYDNSDEDAKRLALQKLDNLKKVDLLVLDDFGSEYAKSLDWLYNTFLKLIKSRYSQNRPTLMSTNLNAESLMDKFSEDVAPRLSSVFSEAFEIMSLYGTKDMRKTISKTRSLYEDMKEETK